MPAFVRNVNLAASHLQLAMRRKSALGAGRTEEPYYPPVWRAPGPIHGRPSQE